MKKAFKINITQSVLTDLNHRLAATRWPDEIENDDWKRGANKKYLKELCGYWHNKFDWRKQEVYLNTFSHYRTTIDDSGIHFIHEKGKGRKTIPVLLTHGFPDSFVRFLKLIPMLTEADEYGFSFDVIVPSIPGYGFSDIPDKAGMDPKRIGGIFNQLMNELGYDQYFAHGGDWGTSITEQIALYHAGSLLGIHLTDVPFAHGMMPLAEPSHAEEKFKKKMEMWVQTEGAYALIQSTKPQSLAYGLNDSPAGLAAWIIEKFYAWSDNNGDLNETFDRDEVLTNLTIYWATQTVNSSMHLYYYTMQTIMNALYNPLVKLNPFDKTGDKTDVPTAFALFPKDISSPPREYAERFFNVYRWTEMPRGGHFAAMEQPELLAQDIRKSFASMLNERSVIDGR